MNKEHKLVELFKEKKTKNYSFVIGFFLLFSFFILFAIRPNLETVFKLQRDLKELHNVDDNYNQVIEHIVELQQLIEKHRDELYLVDQALPSSPQINKVIDDLRVSASDSGLFMKKINIEEVDLKQDSQDQKMKSYAINIESESQFEQLRGFLLEFLQQRRLKTFKDLEVTKEPSIGSNSGTLRIKFQVVGYYL